MKNKMNKISYDDDAVETAWAEINRSSRLAWEMIDIMNSLNISPGLYSCRVSMFFDYNIAFMYLKFKELGTREKWIDFLNEIKYGNTSDDRNKG